MIALDEALAYILAWNAAADAADWIDNEFRLGRTGRAHSRSDLDRRSQIT